MCRCSGILAARELPQKALQPLPVCNDRSRSRRTHGDFEFSAARPVLPQRSLAARNRCIDTCCCKVSCCSASLCRIPLKVREDVSAEVQQQVAQQRHRVGNVGHEKHTVWVTRRKFALTSVASVCVCVCRSRC